MPHWLLKARKIKERVTVFCNKETFYQISESRGTCDIMTKMSTVAATHTLSFFMKQLFCVSKLTFQRLKKTVLKSIY